jgi:hypothetical protein
MNPLVLSLIPGLFAIALYCNVGQTVSASRPATTTAASSLTEYRFTHVSHAYDFIVRLDAKVPDGLDGYREGPGQVLVFRKGSAQALQTITVENLFFALDEKGDPLTNKAPLYGDQGLLNVGDFNFDGYQDFAIQTGHEGSYGGPTYSVYLYNPAKTRFELSEPLSSVIEETLGFFQVDTQHKHLITLAKSGCCYHETTKYAVVHNIPVPVSRIIEDATGLDGYVKVTRERRVDGKWQRTTRRVRLPKENPDK